MTSIMVAENDIYTCEVIRQHLEKEGYQVTIAGTGAAALDIALNGPPDLIILDVALPGFPGLETVKAVSATVPFVLLNAQASADDILAGFSAGAADYITKPFNPNELVARVKAILYRTRESIPRVLQQRNDVPESTAPDGC